VKLECQNLTSSKMSVVWGINRNSFWVWLLVMFEVLNFDISVLSLMHIIDEVL
jgi:hypothetical protein